MAGHRITPYELTATRKWPHKAEDGERKLLLATELVREGSLDVLDAIHDNLAETDPVKSHDDTRSVSCVHAVRTGDALDLVFACDVSGEREVVRDPEQGLVVFMKGPDHVARYYSCCRVWRKSDADRGLLLVHSPWGRGGSKLQILRFLQRAVNLEEGAAAKLHANPKVPAQLLDYLMANLNATKITYVKDKSIRSRFSERVSETAHAAVSLVVKGTDTVPFRNGLTAALTAAQNREKFFTIEVAQQDGGYTEETFDDVEITVSNGAGETRYSMARDTIPGLGFDYTPDLTRVYLGLPSDRDDNWPRLLLDGAKPYLDLAQHSATHS